MNTTFSQLIAEQRQAKIALEIAMKKLFLTEKALIKKNQFMLGVTAANRRDAALELVQLVVNEKLNSFAAENDESAVNSAALD
ncbi:MAG: hypothetical protein WCH84_07430 [Verrucomicrobiota bacterium]